MRILVAYYSLGGTTRQLAMALAQRLGADTAEVRCQSYGRGAMGFLKACFDSVTGRLPPVEVNHTSIETYDLVLVGGPVWAGHIATPIRSYLAGRKGQFKRVGYFLTYGGSAIESVLSELAQAGGQTPEATLALRTAQVLGGDLGSAVEDFASKFALQKAA